LTDFQNVSLLYSAWNLQ